MAVLRPRTRLVNFRVDEEEFELLKKSAEITGARSISDHARNQTLGNKESLTDNPQTLGNEIKQLRTQMTGLTMMVTELLGRGMPQANLPQEEQALNGDIAH